MPVEWTRRRLAACIDQTLLSPTATEEQIRSICRSAKSWKFAAVCANPCYLPTVVSELQESEVTACTVIGFPLGANASRTKAAEAELAVMQGAGEVDMVMHIGALKEGRHKYAQEDIRMVVSAAAGALVKVIIEACFLTDEEKVVACQLTESAGAHFVKTSTGFGSGGATTSDVRLIRATVGNSMGVKASGGIRTCNDAVAMLEAGANRIGTSSGEEILAELTS